MLRLGLAMCLALIAPGSGLAAPGVQAHQGRPGMVLGYYVPYSDSSWESLERNAQSLDMVAAQWVSIDACGNLASRDDQTVKQLARSRGLKIVPSLLVSSAWLNHQLLANDDTAVHAVEQIVAYVQVEGYDGLDLDLEGVDAADRPYLTRFVGWLSTALHASGAGSGSGPEKTLTLAVPAKQSDATSGWLGAWDYAALGASADRVTIMAYEYHGPFSGPGSLSPYDWVARVAAFATTQIPAEKVLLGLPVYGYDWNLTSGRTRAVGYQQAMALAARSGAEIGFDTVQRTLTFTYSGAAGDELPAPPSSPAALPGHAITVREPPPCDVAEPASVPTVPTVEPLADGTPQAHEVWLEDSQSVTARLQIADRFGAGGVAVWRLGLEDPQVWTLFDAWRLP